MHAQMSSVLLYGYLVNGSRVLNNPGFCPKLTILTCLPVSLSWETVGFEGAYLVHSCMLSSKHGVSHTAGAQ